MKIRPLVLNISFALAVFVPSACLHAQGWQNAQLLNLPSEPACKTARIYASKNGGFHAVYLNADPWRVEYRRYADGYLGAVKILDGNFAANPDICESGNGDVHVVWEDWEDGNYPGYAVSTNGGSTFAVGKITTWTGCKFPLVAPFGSSNGSQAVMSFTKMKEGESRDIYYSVFDGSVWAAALQTGAVADNEYMIEGICRALNDGTVYRLYGRALAGQFAQCFRRFNGSYWEPEVIVHTGPFFARQSIAVNPIGQIMVVWEQDEVVRSKLYTPGVGWGPEILQEDKSGYASVAAIPGTNDFYLVYTWNMNRIYGRRFSGGGWLPKELVSVGLPDAFTVGSDVSADPNGTGTIYACWEYWGSGNCQQYFSVRPGGSPPDSTIAGVVRDQYGQGISGATVGTGPYATVSGAGGAYSLAVPAGTYTVSANKEYYTGQSIAGITTTAGHTTYVDFTITANPPAPVTTFNVQPSTGLNRLGWTNPTSGNFRGTMIRFKTTGYPTSPADGTLLCDRAATPGSSDSFTHSGLANGTTYYYSAFTHDDDLHYSTPVNRQGTPHDLTVSEIKQFADGYPVELVGKVVTGVFASDGCIYIGEPHRASGVGGIRVETTQSGISVGDIVNVAGVISTRLVSGYPAERRIISATVTRLSSGAPPAPTAMACKWVGGAAIGSMVPGVKDGVGANNMGSLMRIAGKVTRVIGNLLYVDDGSNVENVSTSGPEVGVMVRCAVTPSVSVGSIVSATGIAEGSIPNVSGWSTNRRCLRLRDANDLRLIYAAPTTGTISGVVKDSSGVGIPGAVVSTNVGGYSATAGAGGDYTLANVAPGTYTVTASKAGYQSQSVPNVAVTVGQTTTVNFTLSPLPSEKLINGGFEEGFADFWGGRIANGWSAAYRNQSSADSSEWSDYNWGSPVNYAQQVYVSLAGTGESGIMQRVTGLTPGTSFRFSAYAYQSNTNSSCWIGVDANGGTSLPSRSTSFANAAGQWNYAEVTGTVGSSGAVSVFLWVWHQTNPPGTCWFDNASLLAL